MYLLHYIYLSYTTLPIKFICYIIFIYHTLLYLLNLFATLYLSIIHYSTYKTYLLHYIYLSYTTVPTKLICYIIFIYHTLLYLKNLFATLYLSIIHYSTY